ncbi:MAG: glycosyltransferase family 39 protein [Lachnospiraceae bacterium]|nr:glycosyltransferase family 39 protein [Lachnospiraceae bacterium]
MHKKFLIFLFSAGLILRMLLAWFNMGFPNDTACFAGWADRMFQTGPVGFYTSDMFTDYPPGFMYILYLVGAITSFFKLPQYSGAHLLLLKFPAILCDMLCAYVLYRVGTKHKLPCPAWLLSAAYLFNPAILLNSSVWGQADSVYTLSVVLLCLFLSYGKLFPAYITFGIGILIKPQMLVFTPILLMGILDYVFLQDFSNRKFVRNLFQGLLVILGMIFFSLPFGLTNVLSQYTSTLGSYPYASVNAYNFWGLLGRNWGSQDSSFLFLSCKTWGILVIIAIVILTIFFSLRMGKQPYKYPVLAAFIILTMFLFSVRMHERYLYPALVLLLLAYIQKPHKTFLGCYISFSLLHFANTAHVLFFYDAQNYNPQNPVILFISAGMLLTAIIFYKELYKLLPGIPQKQISKTMPPIQKTSFHKLDFILMTAITLLYSAFALHDLGNQYAPATTHDMTQGESITFLFEEDNSPHTLSYYLAPKHNRHFILEGFSQVTEQWLYLDDITLNNVFTWQSVALEEYSLEENHISSLRLTLSDTQASILELVFTDSDSNVLQPANAQEYPALFDENSMFPVQSSFRDSMYFDEIYHGRTAYEFLKGLPTYETTHPPLGKIFIAIGVALFGMNPFGWRIMGTLFGIAMVPVLYLFGKRITGNTPVSALACFLYAFDFMHFTQTRIATIDVFITFFVIIMYYFMYEYCTLDFSKVSFTHTLLPLGACGIAMGLGLASKWTGAYAGVGLAILFFANLIKIPNKKKTIAFCMVFFVAIPGLIYLLSYLPFVDSSSANLWKKMIANQEYIFQYHSKLESTHPYSSTWKEWPVMIRPIWYYSNILSDTMREGISAFGNPSVWWIGIPAFLHMLYLALKKKDRTAVFLIIGYLAQYLPWFFVTRVTFIYHYFPSVAFVVLMIAHSLMQFKNHCSSKVFALILSSYALVAFGLFLLFYPVLSGQPIEAEFAIQHLRWMDTWVLIAG